MLDDIESQYYNVANAGYLRPTGSRRRRGVPEESGVPRKEDYATKRSVYRKGSSRLREILASRNTNFAQVPSYTDLFNTWICGMFPTRNFIKTEMSVDECGRRGWVVKRIIEFQTAEGAVKIGREQQSLSMRVATELVSKQMLSSYYVGSTQMDEVPSKESIQGDATQKSDKESNTIVTRDQQETIGGANDTIYEEQIKVASSEPTFEFENLVSRWMPVKVLKITTTQKLGEVIASYYLPETFLSDQAKCAPNTIPFETFVYGQYDMAMKFVVNANKFHCGKVIVSAKFDSYQADDINNGYQAALSRPHIILDLSANNEGTIHVPFRYHRAFVRNQTHSTATVGIRPGKYASVYVQILSPLKSGPSGAQDMDIRPFYMYRSAKFAGMSYKVALTQMDTVGTLMQALPTRALKEMILGVERSLDQLGKSNNQDKPTQNNATIVIPRPRLCFPHGKGVSDAVVMRMNPTALTSFNHIRAFSDDPKTTLAIARIWGIRSTFNWSSSKVEGTELFASVIDPTSRYYDQDYKGQPTPLEYVSSFYNFWSGPIELRFDFVSNSFHTGAVLISAEFNRTSTDTDECQSHSTYTKTFHLGEQKSVKFVVPYIYDTVMRRNTGLAFCPIVDNDVDTNDDIKKTSIGIRAESKMKVKVRVINALRPVASAPQEIEVLVFMRSGRNFVLHGLCQSSFWDSRDIVPIDSFPSDNYLPTKPTEDNLTRRKRDTQSDYEKRVLEHRYLPKEVANRWNEYKAGPRAATQMDTGSKEDEDPTDNFSQGISSFGIQSMDSQVGIKDILRRPVLLFDKVKIENQYTGFFIPLMPPSRMMQYDRNKKQETLYQNLLGVTPQAAIMNLFRFWRGSMRYTIIVHDKGSSPVYVTHVPHSGIRKFGVIKINEVDNSRKTPIFGSGLTTEMIIPTVNPTLCVEAPFDTENNWCLTFEEDALRNYSWRDKGDTVSGHLVITPTNATTVSIWWSAGDDFEVANFYGVPSVVTNHWKYQFSDEHARVQMDEGFTCENVSTAVGALWNDVKKMATPQRVVRTLACSVPYVGPGFATATLVEGANQCLNTTNELVANANTKIEQLSEKLGESVDYITKYVQDIVNSTLGTMQSASSYASYCFDVILDILVAWTDKSWTAIGVGIVRFLAKIFGIKIIASLMEKAVELGRCIAEMMRPQRARVEAPPERTATMVGVLAGIIGTIVGVRISPNFGRSFFDSLLIRITDARGMSYLALVLRFVESTFTIIKDMILHALGYVSPQHEALRMLSGTSEILDRFITDAHIITTEANSMLVQDPNYRYKFWNTVMQAYQIQKLLVTAPTANVSPILTRLCGEVIKTANEKFVDISASPVRYEPLVICIEGASGIGKSEIVEALVSKLLNGINVKRPYSGGVYFRMPGSRFWSGYRDQPVVAYDDWANLTDPTLLAQQVSELYQLKSTSTFIPEMAHLEEKKIRGNPLVVILLCNEAFPHNALSSLAHTPAAIYRRRDILLRAMRREGYENTALRDMTTEEQQNFSHLEFKRYTNPADHTSLGEVKVDFNRTSAYLVSKMQKWHAQEQIKVKRRLENIQAGLAQAPIHQVRLEDPFALYYSVATQVSQEIDIPTSGFLPSEILAAEVRRIANMVEQHQVSEAEIIVPEEPQDPFVPTTQLEGGTIRGMCLGLATARVTLGTIIGMSSEVLSQSLSWLLARHSPYKECSICGENNRVAYYCAQGMELQGEQHSSHYVCTECVKMARRSNAPITTCPVCRSERIERWGSAEQLLAMSLLARVATKCLLTTDQIVSSALQLFGNGDGMATALTAVLRTGVLLSGYLTGHVTPDGVYAGQLVGNIMDRVTLLDVTMPTFQSDEDPFEEPGVHVVEWEEDNPPPDVLRCVVSVTQLQELMDNRESFEYPCLHRYLIDSEHVAKYSGGRFIIPHGGTTIAVPEKLCEECYFESTVQLGQFYQKLLEYQKATYNTSVCGYINNPLSKEYYRERIPLVLRPSWMMVSEPLAEEVRILTREDWWTNLSTVWNNYKCVILTIGSVITAVGGLLMFNKIFRGESRAITEYIGSGDEATRNLRRTVRVLQRERTTRPHFQNLEDQPTLDSVVKKYVARNYVTINLMKPKGRVAMIGCGIYGHKALLPRHYVKAIRRAAEEGIKIEVGPALLPHEWKEYTFDEADFMESTTTDIALWTLPASFGMFKDIRKFIASDEDLSRPISNDGTILLAPTRLNPVLKEQNLELLGLQRSQAVEDQEGVFFEAYDVLSYNFSQPGACGSLVMLSRSQRPIVAMHFAGLGPVGVNGEGFGVILTGETLGEIMEANTAVTQLEEWDGPNIDNAKILFEDTNVSYIGAVSDRQTPFSPKKTKIKPSLIQNVNGLKPYTEPCILDKTDTRYCHADTPLVAGCKKHGKLTRDFTTSTIKRAQEGLWDGWISKLQPCVPCPRKLSPEEAACGIPGLEYYDPVVLNTSAGFPWVTTTRKGKSDYITFNVDENLRPVGAVIDDEVLKVMEAKFELRNQGIQPMTPFIDTLKDERKPKDKVLKYGATRVFCNPPLDYVLSMRQNFLHFTAAFMKHRMKMMHAIGINVTSTEWTLLANKLIDKGINNINTLDYSNFGPGFNAHVANAAMELMVRWTKTNVIGVNERELRVLLHECLNSVHLCHNTLYQQKSGSPSGAPITTVINTLVNLLYILIAWEHIVKESKLSVDYVWEEFEQNVALFCYGDDLIMSVSDKWKGLFNTYSITNFFKDYGIVATDASKGEMVESNQHLTKSSFLKHGFGKHDVHPHIWQSKLAWISINDTTQWIWECADMKLATRENCEAALLQAHGHGREMFQVFKDRINGALIKKKIQPLTLTWEEVDKKFYPELVY